MATMTRDEFIKERMAEGFTREAAEHAYDGTVDPQIEAAQEQKVPTRGEMVAMLAEARQNNPDRAKMYVPDFSLSENALKLKKQLEDLKGKEPYDAKKAQEISRQILSIKVNGTITDEMRQAEIDKTLEMPVANLIAQRKKYEKIIVECEEKIDNFDVSGVQAKVDALTAQYDKKASNRGQFANNIDLHTQYNKEIDKIELDEVKKPLNDLAIKRYEAMEYYLIYEARIKFYVKANKELIEEEIVAAKREEIRGSLADLAEYVEG